MMEQPPFDNPFAYIVWASWGAMTFHIVLHFIFYYTGAIKSWEFFADP